MTITEEQKLIERAKTDSEAFGQLYDEHYLVVFNYVLRRTGDAQLAQDLTADVFIKALTKMHSFAWLGRPFAAWLYRIAGRSIADHFRGKHTKNISLEVLMDELGFEPVDETDIHQTLVETETALERHQQYTQVREHLKTLPTKYQEVFALRYFEKKSIAEIAVITARREGTVKSLLSRGAKKIREKMT